MTRFRKLLLINIGPYLGAVVIFVILLTLIKNDIKTKADTIIQQRQNLLSKSQSIKSLATLRSQYESAKSYFSLLDNILPPKDQMINFSKDLESFAKKNQLGFGFVFGNETPSNDVEPGFIDFQTTLKGSYENFISFLKATEKSRYFINFSSLELTRGAGSELETVINGKVFSR